MVRLGVCRGLLMTSNPIVNNGKQLVTSGEHVSVICSDRYSIFLSLRSDWSGCKSSITNSDSLGRSSEFCSHLVPPSSSEGKPKSPQWPKRLCFVSHEKAVYVQSFWKMLLLWKTNFAGVHTGKESPSYFITGVLNEIINIFMKFCSADFGKCRINLAVKCLLTRWYSNPRMNTTRICAASSLSAELPGHAKQYSDIALKVQWLPVQIA